MWGSRWRDGQPQSRRLAWTTWKWREGQGCVWQGKEGGRIAVCKDQPWVGTIEMQGVRPWSGQKETLRRLYTDSQACVRAKRFLLSLYCSLTAVLKPAS
jgi:hypothetical protein